MKNIVVSSIENAIEIIISLFANVWFNLVSENEHAKTYISNNGLYQYVVTNCRVIFTNFESSDVTIFDINNSNELVKFYYDKCDDLHNENVVLTNTISNLKGDIEKLQDDINAKDVSIEFLSDRKEIWRKKFFEKSEFCDGLLNRIDILEHEKNSYTKELEERVTNLQIENDKLNRITDYTDNLIPKLYSEIDTQTEQINILYERLANTKKEMDRIKQIGKEQIKKWRNKYYAEKISK